MKIKIFIGGVQMNKKIIWLIISTFLILMILNISVLAQEENQDSETVYINANNLKYENNKTILNGNIEIRKNDTLINAEKGELIRDENKLLLENEINVEYNDGKVKSTKLTALLKEEEYIFENNVTLEYMLEDEEENMVLTSNYLKIFGDNNSFIAKNTVSIKYQGKNFKGDNAEYVGDEEILYLTGNVLIEEGQDWVKSDKAQFFLGSEDKGYSADGNVEIKITLD
jgi:lipopolysaccharide export system protein LptA